MKKWADEGYHVFVSGRTEEKINDTCAQINESDSPGKATPVLLKCLSTGGPFDRADFDTSLMEQDIADLFDAACGAGHCDCVIYNLGPNMTPPPPNGRTMETFTVEFVTYM